MSEVTVLLVVTIIALAVGNALLFMFPSRKQEGQGEAIIAPHHHLHSLPAALDHETVSSLPLQKKIELAHVRIQALESRVKSMQGIYEDALKGKVEKLESFRDTANAEIIALKELVDELQKKNGLSTQKHRAKEKPITDDELRKLIYRSST